MTCGSRSKCSMARTISSMNSTHTTQRNPVQPIRTSSRAIFFHFNSLLQLLWLLTLNTRIKLTKNKETNYLHGRQLLHTQATWRPCFVKTRVKVHHLIIFRHTLILPTLYLFLISLLFWFSVGPLQKPKPTLQHIRTCHPSWGLTFPIHSYCFCPTCLPFSFQLLDTFILFHHSSVSPPFFYFSLKPCCL
jgi:hypothetical protein